MSALPPWIERRINRRADFGAVRVGLVESLLQADRPFLSTRQLCTDVFPDIEDELLLEQLDELRASDIIARVSYDEPATLHYIRYPVSKQPPAVQSDRHLTAANPLDHLSLRRFLTMRDTAGVRTLVLAGFQLSLLLLALGSVLTVLGIDPGSKSDLVLWDTAFDLFGVSLLLLVTERVVHRVRSNTTD